jgi:hypothetical protein
VLECSASLSVTLSAGLTASTAPSGALQIVTITGGTGTVTFS